MKELYDLYKMHLKLKKTTTSIKPAVLAAKYEQKALSMRASTAAKALTKPRSKLRI